MNWTGQRHPPPAQRPGGEGAMKDRCLLRAMSNIVVVIVVYNTELSCAFWIRHHLFIIETSLWLTRRKAVKKSQVVMMWFRISHVDLVLET